MIKVIKYKGAACANCLSKIKDIMIKNEKVEKFEYDFINGELVLEGNIDKSVINLLIKTVKKIEPDMKLLLDKNYNNSTIDENITCDEHCNCKDNHDEAYDHNHEKLFSLNKYINIISYIIGFILLVVGIIQDNEILMIIAYLIFSWDILLLMLKNFKNLNFFDENTLMAVASIGAILINEHIEAIAVILLYKFGEYLQDKAVDKSKDNIKGLLELQVEEASLKTNDGIQIVHPSKVKKDDIIIVKPGEKVPLDGIILKGSSFLDLKALTGESKLIDIHENQEVLSGSLNTSGLIEIKVIKEYNDSTINKITKLLKDSVKNKSKTEKFITKFSKIYTPIVFLLAIIIGLVIPYILSLVTENSFNYLFNDYIKRALTFLVISCPCALVISVPLAYFAGIGISSKNSILIKGSNYLDEINKVNKIAFDKTGTLTKGNFVVSLYKNYGDIEDDLFLKYIAYSEYYSNHPIAKSIIKYYNKDINEKEIINQEELPGYGIKSNINNNEVLLGNSKLLKKYNITFKEENIHKTILYLSVNNKYMGYLLLEDEVKEESKNVIKNLNSRNITTVLLTGDNQDIANEVGNNLGIKEIYSKLLPEDKVNKAEELMINSTLLYVGDGINDAPVLVKSNIGVAMGSGSDLAIENADVIIVDDNLNKIKTLFDISKLTRKIAIQNIVFALSIKLLVLLISSIGYPNMWLAIIADVGVSILAIFNSIRILKFKEKNKKI